MIAKDLSFLHVDSKELSVLADAQAGLSFQCIQSPHCWFCYCADQFQFTTVYLLRIRGPPVLYMTLVCLPHQLLWSESKGRKIYNRIKG